MPDSFSSRDTVVIAVAQEDKDLQTHGQILQNFKPDPWFHVVCDIDRKATPRYDRTTTYLIDKAGVVQQIFPMLIHSRPDWKAILSEIDRLYVGS